MKLKVIQIEEDIKDLRKLGAKRKCGECTACCTVLGIREPTLDKDPHIPCTHATSSGCSIYEERPFCCKDFFCAWQSRLPEFTRNMRPDKFGIVTWYSMTQEMGLAYVVDECIPGALQYRDVQDLVHKISFERPVCVAYKDEPVVLHKGKIVARAALLSRLDQFEQLEI